MGGGPQAGDTDSEDTGVSLTKDASATSPGFSNVTQLGPSGDEGPEEEEVSLAWPFSISSLFYFYLFFLPKLLLKLLWVWADCIFRNDLKILLIVPHGPISSG